MGRINNNKLTLIYSFLSLEQLVPGTCHPANSTWEADILKKYTDFQDVGKFVYCAVLLICMCVIVIVVINLHF